jgi:hypothetical protein
MKKILTIAALTLLTLDGCNKNNENGETPPYAASTQTWTFGDQTWSDAIRIPACNKSDFISPDFIGSITAPDCRSYTYGSTTWHYYNWPYVIANHDKMCPAPWRVPSREDFERLDANTNDKTLAAAWELAGFAYGSSMNYDGSYGYYWSSTEYDTRYACILGIVSGSAETADHNKGYGYQVRCVR